MQRKAATCLPRWTVDSLWTELCLSHQIRLLQGTAVSLLSDQGFNEYRTGLWSLPSDQGSNEGRNVLSPRVEALAGLCPRDCLEHSAYP